MQQLYPILPSTLEPDQRFRLARIGEQDTYLTREVEDRRNIQKNYQRAVNITQRVCTGVGVVGLGMEAVGLALIATGIGTLPGMVLSALGAGAFVVDLACAAIGRKLAAKAQKHGEIMQVARTKLNSIHQHVAKSMEDNKISDDEFKHITDELERYQSMKEEIRSKARSATTDAEKNAWIQQGKDEVRKQFAKQLGVTSPPK